MLFNSIEFLLFVPLAFVLYWALRRRHRAQNVVVLIASYVFYGWWDWRFLLLILTSSLVAYGTGLAPAENPRRRRRLLMVSLLVNLGILGFFKYYNFFVASLVDSLATIGVHLSAPSLRIILPVGISFYTFQALSYSIDVYRRKIEPAHDLVAFLAYVSFFPQLVAGPIERAGSLLPQFLRQRSFSEKLGRDGLKQIVWGFFKKMVIADNCAIYVDHVFTNQASLTPFSLLLGLNFFAWQIYGDFSGYSDIAIGTARLFGFDLMVNFRKPYFSRDMAEFWRRWHISLTTWFRDYLYVPMGGSRCGRWQQMRNVMIVFVVSGLWHGANWTFVIWGALNALFFLTLLMRGTNRQHQGTVAAGRRLPSWRELRDIILTYCLTLVAWTFFRSQTAAEAVQYLGRVLNLRRGFISLSELREFPAGRLHVATTLLFIAACVVLEWMSRDKADSLDIGGPRWLRGALYTLILTAIGFCGVLGRTEFIYFRF